jgi:cytochrome P450
MLGDMSAYVRDLAGRRRAEPADDLITGLTLAHSTDSDRLSDVELVTMVLSLMIAGHETTAHLIGNGVLALLTHPGQLGLLREEPELMPGAVQELLRYCGPIVSAMVRYAGEEVKLGDTLIERGDRVQVVLAAANHDPRRFEDPERLDVTRKPDGAGIQHLAYSYGAHYCLGASLANQEAEVALAGLLTTYPGLALAAEPEDLEWKTIPSARQLVRLPVTLQDR